jgi:hypothetical protein
MSERPQNYANHRRLHPVLHLVVGPILLLYLAATVWWAVRAPSGASVITAVFALGVVLLSIGAREMAVRLQDRIIRLEMRLRLAEVLPPELRSRIRELSVRQLVSLRFASDAEMTDLVRKTLEGGFAGGDEIKRAIKDWQADRLRV